MTSLAILGSTGSIGTQTLDVVRTNPDRYRATGLTTNGNIELLGRQIEEFAPDFVVVAEECSASVAQKLYGNLTEVLAGEEGLIEAATRTGIDTVVSGLVGFAGLAPTIAAVRAGKRVALANKETLVVAGELITHLVREHGGILIPIDSEHSALFQCLAGEPVGSVEELILTASGGPFRTTPIEEFGSITLERALKHPNWDMGPKITVDSATMMNKGLEVIEARWLFDIPASRIRIVVHPQSIVHSMVGFIDGSVKAQLGLPDMRLPIQYALAWPERIANDYERLSLSSIGTLTFEEADRERFPALRLAYEALDCGGTAPAILNAANEVAVAAFLEGTTGFTDIPRLVERALDDLPVVDQPSLEDILAADKRTREQVRSYLIPNS